MNPRFEVRDLTLGPPRSPRVRLGNYVICARTIDVCRASLVGSEGKYRFGCPLDQMLFTFKEITADDFKARVLDAESDSEVLAWLEIAGTRRSPEETIAWSMEREEFRPWRDGASREWFTKECRRLGLTPQTTTLFEYLEIDDRMSFHPESAVVSKDQT
ncbi:MAG TPA: DUF5069 domain-containing protein [Chthoniobacterales bacterium]